MAGEITREQEEKILLLELENYGVNLQYIEKQTEEICLVAVKDHGSALRFVEIKQKKYA